MKKKILIGIGVVVLIAVLITVNLVRTKNVAVFGGAKPIEVNMVKARVQDINETINVNGEIQEVDSEDIYFSAPVRVNSVLVEKDQHVRKGQKLVDLDMDDLYSQIEQGKVNLNIQQIGLDRVKDTLKTQNTAQLQSALEQSQTAMNLAKKTLDRNQTLYNQGAVTLSDYENAKTQYDNTKIQYSVAQNNLADVSSNNDLLVNGNQKDVQNQTEQLRLTELKIQDLESKITKLTKESMSPIDGVIVDLNLQRGSTTNPAMLAMHIVNPDKLEIKLEVKEIDILKVKDGQEVEVTGDAFPDKTMKGVVKSVGAVARKKQGVSNSDESFVEVIVTVDNRKNELKPGMTVNAKIITSRKSSAVIISFDSFVEDKDGNKSVFQVENGIAKQKNIAVGISSGLDLEVTGGLKGNEVLIQDAPARLKDGMSVVASADSQN